jgi:hypothetical protein
VSGIKRTVTEGALCTKCGARPQHISNGHQYHWCQECKREYDRDWYVTHQQQRQERVQQQQRQERRQEQRQESEQGQHGEWPSGAGQAARTHATGVGVLAPAQRPAAGAIERSTPGEPAGDAAPADASPAPARASSPSGPSGQGSGDDTSGQNSQSGTPTVAERGAQWEVLAGAALYLDKAAWLVAAGAAQAITLRATVPSGVTFGFTIEGDGNDAED